MCEDEETGTLCLIAIRDIASGEFLSVAVDGGAAETIPQMEFKLLFKLLSYPDKIFTRRQLLDELWGMDKDVDERTVDVHVKRLRERYGSCESFDIVTVRGLGYKAVKKQ